MKPAGCKEDEKGSAHGMPERLLNAKAKTVGAKQTLKAVEKGEALVVFVARDADSHIVQPIIDGCRARGIELVYVDSIEALGRYCHIDVGAATAALVRR